MAPITPVQQARQAITARDYDGALRLLDPYLARTPGDLDALHLAGVAYFETRRYTAAENTYLEMWSIQPGDVRATYGVAVVAERVGRLDEAEQWLRATLALDPSFDRAAKRLASLRTARSASHHNGREIRHPGGAPPRPLTTLMVPNSPEEVAEYERWAREKARIDMMNEHWHGIPWPVRALQVMIGIAVLVGLVVFLVNAGP